MIKIPASALLREENKGFYYLMQELPQVTNIRFLLLTNKWAGMSNIEQINQGIQHL